MENFIPFILGGAILLLVLRGRGKAAEVAPFCPNCNIKMKVPFFNSQYRKQHKPEDPFSQYGRTYTNYVCPNCSKESFK